MHLINKIILFIILLSLSLSAQEKISVEVSVDKQEITMGDLIKYEVKIKADENYTVFLPELGINLDKFEIRDYKTYPPIKENGYIVYKIDYWISIYYVGTYKIPSISIKYKTPEGKEGTIKSEEIEIKVKSLAPEDTKEFRDVKGPVLPIPNYRKLYITLGIIGSLIAIAVLIIVLIRYYKKRKAGIVEPPPPPLPPHEIALKELEKLLSSDLLEKKKYKVFFDKLTQILKTYLEKRYNFPATDYTTSEVIEFLDKRDVEGGIISLVANTLKLADLVKFAKHTPEGKEIDSAVENVRTVVNLTKLVSYALVSQSAEEKK